MLSLEKLTISIYARGLLLADEEIQALVGDKIFPSIAPTDTPSPFVVYERDAYSTYDTKFGIYREEAKVVFEVVTDDYDEGLQIAVAIHRVLQGKHGEFDFQIVDSAEFHREGKFRQLLDFKIV